MPDRPGPPGPPDPRSFRSRQDFAAALTDLRERAGLSVRDVARAANLSASTVGGYFSGAHLPPLKPPTALRDVLRACGVTDPPLLACWEDALRRLRRSPGPRTAEPDATPGPDVAPGPLVVLTGPPGAGKTTVARLLVERYALAVHLHCDDFWHVIRSGSVPPYLPAADRQNGVVMTALGRAAAAYADGGYHVIADGIVGPWFLDRFRAAAGAAGDRMHYLVLRPDEPTALHRAVHRAPDALTDPGPVLAMYRQFADLGPLEGHVLDPTGQDAGTTAQRVHDAVAGGRFRLPPLTRG